MKHSMRYWRKGVAGALALAAALVLGGCEQLMSNPPADVLWTAQADGGDAAASTKIDFVFDRAVADLSADAVAITDDTGRVTKGALTGSGTEWSLGIIVQTAGDVTVAINKDGVAREERTVTVYKGPPLILGWSASANGVEGSEDSTAIDFLFSGEVAELNPEDISITEHTGRAVKGALAGSGREWSLGIAVETAGDVAVSISREGVEAISRNVAVYKAGQSAALTWTARANGASGTEDSTLIAFTLSGASAGLSADDISITAKTGSVIKGALTGSGREWSLGITVVSAGDVTAAVHRAGIETTARDVAVYKAGQSSLISWEAEADGREGTADSTAINIVFSGEIAGLTADSITVTDDTGSVTKGALAGSGTSRTLGIAVKAPGTVKVSIHRAGIEAAEKTLVVHKAPDIAYSAAADGSAAATSANIVFVFDRAVPDLTAEDITVADDTGSVTTGALSGGETSWSLGIAVAAAGTVKVAVNKAGVEAAEKTVTVYKADSANNDTVYSAAANGGAAADSTAIVFAFSAAVPGLTAEDITLTDGTGSAVKGTLTGGGMNWTLGIAVTTAGTVKVAITKAGVEAAEKTVTAHKFVPLAYSVAADGAADTATSAKIDFTFTAAVAGLTAGDISLANDTGSVTKGALSGSGTNWTLGIAVITAGNVKVAIHKTGIDAAEKTLTVHKAPDIGYTAAADGAANTTTSAKIDFVFSAAVAGLTAEDISLADDTGAASKGALTGGGTSWTLGIAVSTAGNVKVRINRTGIENTERTLTVHKAPAVDIGYSALADGDAGTASTKIDLTFTAAVAGLIAGDISLAGDTGSVIKGALTGSGTSWTLGIAVTRAGSVKVAINKAGIEAAEKTVAVYRPLITYEAAADSTGGTEASARIDLIFSEAVEGLSLGNIRFADGAGSAYPMDLVGSGQNWSLEIVTISSGDIRISIEKEGIEGGEKIVTVYKPEEEPPEVAVKTGIAVISPPDITIYAKNQPFDRTGLAVGWVYSDGTLEPIPEGGYSVEAPNMGVSTIKKVNVQAGGYSAYFWIQVLNSDKALVSISVEGPANKIQDFGKEFDKTGLVVTGQYSDGSTANLTSLAAVVDYNQYKRGPQAAIVKVNGKTAALEGIVTRIGEGAAVSANWYTLSGENKQELNYRKIYIKGEEMTPQNSNLKIRVDPNGVSSYYGIVLSPEDGSLTPEDFATLAGYNPYQTGWQRPSITVDGIQVYFDIRVVDTEAAVWFDYGYMRHDGDPGGRGPGAGKYYARPDETLVIAPARYLLGYNADHSDAGVSYAWTVSGDDSSRTWTTSGGGELLHITPKTAGTYTITVDVTGRDYVSGSVITKTAAAELVCYAAPLPGGTFVSPPPLRNFAPGQFTDGGSGYGWSLGSIGGYMVWTVDHQPSYEIKGNPFGTWCEPGVVWMQEDNNGNGLPDETWYELPGGDDDDPYQKNRITRRYAITWFRGDGTVEQHRSQSNRNRVSYWVDSKGRTGMLDPGAFPGSEWGVTGNWVAYTCTLLRDDGNIGTSNYSDLVAEYYVDASYTTFPVSKAMRADGTPANLTAVKFIKVQTARFRYGGIFGEVSTEVKYADGLGYLTDFPDP
ncbi:MAG: hypothetical protein LBG14_01785 [Treponema sp.]|nr:hypothetical protein [Treponema sp.]